MTTTATTTSTATAMSVEFLLVTGRFLGLFVLKWTSSG